MYETEALKKYIKKTYALDKILKISVLCFSALSIALLVWTLFDFKPSHGIIAAASVMFDAVAAYGFCKNKEKFKYIELVSIYARVYQSRPITAVEEISTSFNVEREKVLSNFREFSERGFLVIPQDADGNLIFTDSSLKKCSICGGEAYSVDGKCKFCGAIEET